MAKPASGTSLDTGHALYTNVTAVWAMLEGSGASSADSRGTRTLTLNGGYSWTTNGGGDPIVDFAGTNASPATPATSLTLSIGTDWSIAWRGQIDSSGANTGMVLGDGSGSGNFLWFNASGGQISLRDNATNTSSFNVTGANQATTANYLLVRDNTADTLTLYRNGSSVASNPAGGAGGLVISEIGDGYSSNTFALDGKLEYVYVWSGRALSSSDATALNTDPYDFFAAATGTVTITTPARYKTFQRTTNGLAGGTPGGTTGAIAITGTYTGTPTAIRARFNGGSWATIDASPSGGTYSGSLTGQAEGQGALDVDFSNDSSVTSSKADIGIGEVFLVAGQSNAEGRLDSARSYTHGSLKATVFREDDAWADGNDPTDTGTADGSLWPLLATRIMAEEGVPVAFITTAEGSTNLSTGDANWASPSGTSFTASKTQVTQSGVNSVRAVLFYQGEGDVLNSVARATHLAALENMADAYATDVAGAPKTIPIQIGFQGAGVDNVRLAIGDSWDTNSNCLGGVCVYDISNETHPGDTAGTVGEGQTIADRIWAVLSDNFYGGSHSGRGPLTTAATYSGSEIYVDFDGIDTGLTLTASLWSISDGNGRTVSSVSYSGNRVTVTASGALAAPVTVSLGLGSSTAGKTPPKGPDITMPGGAGTLNLPAEPFSALTATAASSGNRRRRLLLAGT
jgi:hypothetical protein